MRKLLIAGIAAVLVAGCGTATQHATTAPSLAAVPTETTATGTTPTPTPTATAAPSPSSSPAKPALAAGRQGTRADVPWSQVGANWFLATWSHEPGRGVGPPPSGSPAPGPDTLFLIDPAGGRYALDSFPDGPDGLGTLTNWSGDGTRAVFLDPYRSGGTSGVTVEDLRTGNRAHIASATAVAGTGITGASVSYAQFTAPHGEGLLLTVSHGSPVSESLVRTDLTGHSAAVIGPADSDESAGAVYSPDGTTLYRGGGYKDDTIAVFGNDGSAHPALHINGATGCQPKRFIDAGTLLASCESAGTMTYAQGLWSVPVDGSAATMLTAKVHSARDNGDLDALPLGSDSYVETAGGCGMVYVSHLGTDGKTTPLDIPGATDGDSQFLIGTDGAQRLAVQTSVACGSGISLLWFNPKTQSEQILLGPGANGGGVRSSLEFGTTPAG